MKWRVLGCGVSGLTGATVLAEAGFDVEIWARDLPPNTTSDVAAAYWHPYRASPRDPVLRWSQASLERFIKLADDPCSGVHLAPVLQVSRGPSTRPWWGAIVPDLEAVVPSEISTALSEFESGYTFSAPVADTRRYLPYLRDRLETAGGRVFQREITALAEAEEGVDGLLNSTGLGARELTGDDELFPIRGEIVRVPNPGIDRVIVDEHSDGGPTYVVPRRDECILGGTALDGVEDLAPDAAAQTGIRKRCGRLEPRVAELEPTSVAVGLRPGRSVVRLELDVESARVPIVHNYGHGGAGVTLSWGCALETLELVRSYSGSSASSTAVP